MFFIGSNRISVYKHGKVDIKSEQEIALNEKREKWNTAEDALKHEETLAESGRLFIRNLSYSVTEEIIEELFSKYGN